MTLHADVVRNDWKAGKQTRVGTVTVNGEAEIRCDDPGLLDKLREPVRSADGHGALLTVADGEAFVQALARRWSGDYVLVTELHDDGACSFADESTIAMKTASLQV